MPLVIIADDDELVIDIVRQALEARGHVVGALSDGGPVRNVVELKRPDVVILDCSMEQVSGITALKEIRSSKASLTPVLVLTARRSATDENIALGAGANDYLRKPFDPDELVARVEALIDKAALSALRAAPRPASAAPAWGTRH
jgi:DNA-binding response OmpR family regulator